MKQGVKKNKYLSYLKSWQLYLLLLPTPPLLYHLPLCADFWHSDRV